MFFEKHVEISFYECFVLFEIPRKKIVRFPGTKFWGGEIFNVQ